jgi:hypothetical protein
MTYYRMALQELQSSRWTWKSTVLTSLDAVLRLLRIYGVIPQERIRVYTASSKEDMDEMLSRENNGLASGSVTGAQFLRARNIHVQATAWDASEQGTAGRTTRQLIAIATCSPSHECSAATYLPGGSGISSLDKKRLEMELGPGGDHDTPYLFSFPISTPQLVAWTRLLARVQVGELQA